MKSMKVAAAVTALGFAALKAAAAYDATATVHVGGSLMQAQKDKASGDTAYSWLSNAPKQQKDDDGIEIDFDAGLCGAHLALWYTSALSSVEDGWAAYFRRTYVWFKPVDSVTIRAGYVGTDSFFKEEIDSWKVGSPFALLERDWVKHPAYINCSDVDGWGFGVEFQPLEQLVCNAGIAPGGKDYAAASDSAASVTYTTGDEKPWVAPWGAGVKYYWRDFEFQASYRDGGRTTDGKNNPTWSVARFGAGYTGESIYAFVQPILGFDYNGSKDKTELNGLCIDLYGEYSLDAWKFFLHAPVTLRFGDADADVHYLEWVAKAQYNFGSFGNLDDVTPYLKCGSNWDDGAWGKAYTRAWLLDSDSFKRSLNVSGALGVGFTVGACEVDVSVQYDRFSQYHKANYGKDWNVSVPFSMKVSF